MGVHIFAWRFRLSDKALKHKQTDHEWENAGWKRKNLSVLKFHETGHDREQSIRELFMMKQYFSYSAGKIFLDGENPFCKVYEYSELNNKTWFYNIKKDEKYDYMLPIISIEMHLYDQGVGILFIQMDNQEYKAIEDIKRINDYGRRTMLAFLPDREGGFITCADELNIICKDHGEEQSLYHADFRKQAAESYQSVEALKNLAEPVGFLYCILNGSLGRDRGDTSLKAWPVIDDRMFTMSIVRDNELSEKLKEPEWDEELKKQLYSLIYIDPDSPSCQDSTLLEDLLKHAVYPRWREAGTLYGVTAYSMLCITSESEEIEASVIRPFLVEYLYFVSLVLAQWMEINAFAEKLADQSGVKTWISRDRKFIHIQEEYIRVKNKLLISEISNQEQGIEIYHLLQKALMIEAQKSNLDEQLNSLYEMINVKKGNWLQYIAIVLAVAALFSGWEGIKKFIECVMKLVA